jgi:hypothetical protein
VEMRKAIQQRVRSVRKQLEKQSQTASGDEQEQLEVLADYALAVQTAVNLDGKQPFDYAGIAAYEALRAIHASLQEVEKKGRLPAQHASRSSNDSRRLSPCFTTGRAEWSR